MDEICFKGRVVLITGAAGGLGEALCLRFAEAGARIAALDLDAAGLHRLQSTLDKRGTECRTYVGDITSEDWCRETVEQVAKEWGEIHVLINNAGIAHRSAFQKTKPSVLKRVIDVSLLGSIYCTHYAIDHLISSRGLIIGISSIAGFAPLCGRTGYAAAKHGLAGFLKTLRTELTGTGVDVLLVYATYINTNIDKNALDADGMPNTHEKVTSGQVLSPEEAADAIYLASVNRVRELFLGENAEAAWLLNQSDPLKFEEIMLAMNRYVLDQ